MGKLRKTLLVAAAALCLTFGALHAALADDVVSELNKMGLTYTPELSFAWTTVFHQDTFAVSDLLTLGSPAGPAYQLTTATETGYYTVANPDPTRSPEEWRAADRVIMYGAGHIDEVNVRDDTGVRRTLPVTTTLNMALGNLAVSKVELLCQGPGGDTVETGTVLATDSLTGATFKTTGTKFIDSNRDGIIMYKTYFDFNVVEDVEFYDYNRDGGVHDTDLNADVAGSDKSDRPFLAIYESTGPDVDLTNPPANNVDNDASGSLTDNIWVGNPFAPVNADSPGDIVRGSDGESIAGTPEVDPALVDTTGFGESLLVGELKSLYLLTVVNLNPYVQWSFASVVTTGVFDVKLTDGRLYDWLYATSELNPEFVTYRAVLGGHMLFQLGSNPLGFYEYFNSGLDLVIEHEPVPEPGTGLLILGSVVGLVLRRRRRS